MKNVRRISRLRETSIRLCTGEGPSRLRAGDPEYVELAISYLEADPHFDGTGYAKSDLTRYLKLLPFTATQRERLQALTLRVIDTYGPYGGKHVCRLAASVQSPEFLSEVQSRLDSPDPGIRRRAHNVYDYIQCFNQSTRPASSRT